MKNNFKEVFNFFLLQMLCFFNLQNFRNLNFDLKSYRTQENFFATQQLVKLTKITF